MSSLFNQTNISPGTSFAASGGGGGNSSNTFPQGIVISSGGASAKYLQIDPGVYWGQPSLAVENSSNTATSIPQIFTANPFFALSWDGSNPTTAKSGSYSASNILFQGSNGSGNGVPFLGVIDSALNNTTTALAFQMTGVSSIQSGNYIINSEAFCSTVKGNNWG